MAALGRAVLQCYYRDDRVMRALGLEPRPPYPKGHVLEQGDWSLLDNMTLGTRADGRLGVDTRHSGFVAGDASMP